MPTRVKICGLNSEAALDETLQFGADLVGFVLYAKSPRNVSLDQAAALVARARAHSGAHGGVKTVTLLVDPDDELIDRVVAIAKPDMIQLHGNEPPQRVQAIRQRGGLPIMKAVAVSDADDVASAVAFVEPAGGADILLFDAKPPKTPDALPGGNGLAFDWHILEHARSHAPFALAGGLTPENVAQAIALTGAAIVDVSSGVESRPGEKDPELIRRFLRAAKAAKEA